MICVSVNLLLRIAVLLWHTSLPQELWLCVARFYGRVTVTPLPLQSKISCAFPKNGGLTKLETASPF
jgi:hypothetical protein